MCNFFASIANWIGRFIGRMEDGVAHHQQNRPQDWVDLIDYGAALREIMVRAQQQGGDGSVNGNSQTGMSQKTGDDFDSIR